jgi:dTDP-4-amino-4,6-dideoxygalactose transaminase
MKHFHLFKVHVPVEEALDNIKQVFDSGFINEGSQVTELTEKFKEYFETQNLILVNSCTSALTLALKLSGVEKDDDVVSTSMTCVATNTPISNLGAKIVWADVDPTNGMLDPEDVKKKITKKTKAVIAVAWAGTPPDLEALSNVCKEKNVKLILDAAHAFGASYKNSPLHNWCDFVCYSFQAIKHVTTGDGGALICRSASDYQRSKSMKWFGLDRDLAKDAVGNWKGQQWDVDIVDAGYKFNMNNVSAAIGLAQINHLNKIVEAHQKNARLYQELFRGTEQLQPAGVPEGSNSSYWVFTVKLKNSKISRDEVLKQLNAAGIHAGVVHVPNHQYTAFKDYKIDLPGVEEFSNNQFSLPCGWWLSELDIKYIFENLKKLLNI